MQKFKAWISAARLRTLPLSIAGILMGSSLAFEQKAFDQTIFWLAILTTLSFQILSNFANDYGDGVKGTDNDDRLGPQRALQSGALTDKELKRGIIINSIIGLVLAIALIYKAFGQDNFLASLLFFALGILATIAAIKYTVGDTAYGYKGLGDVFVFVFFGLVAVLGSQYLMTNQFYEIQLLPATSIGLLSAAVLNLNNMRDENSDRNSNKLTLVVKHGKKFAKIYHVSLICIAILCLVFYGYFRFENDQWLSLIGCIPLLIHLKKVINYTNPKDLDPELKKVALSCFAIALIYLLASLF
ncbi:1,4-dihydroxy-2-naphthoate prenyltransferase [Psychroflexus salarius]|uniref:1,4-dihydroxy-2-naphthoate octaprenyltransferase n=1 Tax=Psychroflexus salarius TaxID=1155689 RepID=A0A1M4W154_9FLAO|nr:1,4-dihydroxy-2-naphthoate octaprenyltransferase [Psychroflexus salarius]SHE74978.1 1,4-dihydroxy-2-naphthoate prenyltransferase [Psychroflexus salarius]